MNVNIPEQRFIIEHYGNENQFGIHMEECAELIQAISKYKRYGTPESRDLVIEEIADVIICIEQLKDILVITDDDIEFFVRQKTKRQNERMFKEKENGLPFE